MKHSVKKSDNISQDAKVLRAFIACILALAFFGCGFLARGYEPLMSRLGIGMGDAGPAQGTEDAPDVSSIAAHLNEVQSILQAESVDSFDVTSSTQAVLDAFLASTDDKYARYVSPDRYSTYVDVAKSDYPGIGVLFSEYNGQAYALDVFEGSSAADAGVMPGDFVVAIDGDSSQAWSARETINAVQRESGSTVVVMWRRAETLDSTGGEQFTTTLTTGSYSEPNVSVQKVGDVGYIALHQFTQSADSLVRQAIEQLTEEGAKAFVLDIRDNPGGYISQAVNVASLFIKSGTIVEISTLTATTTREATGNVATEAPLVVLVNGNTSGSAEVLAAALRDTDRATLVGTTTMGKGSVQITTPLSFGGALRYTAARYTSPSGYQIDGVGVAPSLSVVLNDKASTDNQKEVALETAASLIGS